MGARKSTGMCRIKVLIGALHWYISLLQSAANSLTPTGSPPCVSRQPSKLRNRHFDRHFSLPSQSASQVQHTATILCWRATRQPNVRSFLQLVCFLSILMTFYTQSNPKSYVQPTILCWRATRQPNVRLSLPFVCVLSILMFILCTAKLKILCTTSVARHKCTTPRKSSLPSVFFSS
jgi:hypothetical protein